MRLFDAHNHLQDERLLPWIDDILTTLPGLGVCEAVVNGSCEDDWEAVALLARLHSWVRPSFGLHPWYVKARTKDWKSTLLHYIDLFPNGAVGEIGLDRWIADPDLPAQEEAFHWQLEVAAERELPVTIHCLRAWGLLESHLSSARLPKRGFLLHSYGGPPELVAGFARLGAYFSLSPYFTHERKARQAQTFATVPLDRLLAESDAPDMWPPDELNPLPLRGADGKPLNHPANLRVSYDFLARQRQMPVEALATQIEQNHRRLFGSSAL